MPYTKTATVCVITFCEVDVNEVDRKEDCEGLKQCHETLVGHKSTSLFGIIFVDLDYVEVVAHQIPQNLEWISDQHGNNTGLESIHQLLFLFFAFDWNLAKNHIICNGCSLASLLWIKAYELVSF